MALYLSERLNNNLYFTLEKLIFSVCIYIFCPPFFCQSEEKFIKCRNEREVGKFSDSQIFRFYTNSKSSQRILLAFGFIIIFPSHELYKVVRISVICCLPRACSDCAMIRPREHGLAVLVSSTPVLSLLVFIIVIIFGLEVHMPRTCPKSMEGKS